MFELTSPCIMGILNITPDSFSDGGQYMLLAACLRRVETMLAEGAHIIDIGGESTRPNALPVSENEELDRVVPAVEAIRARFDCVLSVDTSTPSVFQAAHAAGAGIWNDVRSLRREGAAQLAAKLQVPVVLMHNRGEPHTMDSLTQYQHVVTEVVTELSSMVQAALCAGVQANNIIIDPGFGFAKNTKHNLALLGGIAALTQLPYPVAIGLSRKRFLGELLAQALEPASVDSRVHAGVAAAQYAVMQGARIIRTHDIKPTADMIALLQRLSQAT